MKIIQRFAAAWKSFKHPDHGVTVHFEGCTFDGLNADGSQPFEFETISDFPVSVRRLKSIRLIGWECIGPKKLGAKHD